MSFLCGDVSDIIFCTECFKNSHGGLMPWKLVVNPAIYADLKCEVEEKEGTWNDNYFGFPIEVDENETKFHFFGPVELKHHVCPLCGWVDRKEKFNHAIDHVDICDHCFEDIYSHRTVNDEWWRQVYKHNAVVRSEMNENYLETYDEILFGEHE